MLQQIGESCKPKENNYSRSEKIKLNMYMDSISKSNIRNAIEYEELEEGIEKD